jgi:hypothetical protein
MIPSGYKEDTVFSAIPSDGSGDLSFTRASDGTRINSAGLVEVCPWNLLEYSEDFANAWWGKDVGSSVDSNVATAPNGTSTADRLNYTSAGQAIYRVISFSGTNKFSVYLKGEGANIGKQIQLEIGAIGGFNVTLTGDWVRHEVEASNATSVAIKKATSGQADAVLAWGIQVNLGSTAKPYFPTTDRLNVPRLTYQNGGGGCPSLLLEKQSTNLAIESEQLNLWNGANASVTANTSVSPDGTQNADNVNITATNGYWRRNPLTFANSTSYTASIFVKKSAITGTKTFGFYYNNNVGSPNNGTWNCVINLTNITATTTAGGTAGTGIPTILSTNIVDYGSGWYRVEVAFTTGSAAGNSGSEIGFEANGVVVDFLAWGAQIEASSYPTSYIPTTSASATRVADAYSRSLSSITAGTAYINITDNVAQGSVGTHLYGPFSITSASLGLHLSRPNNQRLRLWTQASANVFQTTVTNLKLAITWDGTNVNVYQNGVKVVTNYSYALTNVNNLFSNTNLESSATIAEIVLFNSVLTDAECISLTS